MTGPVFAAVDVGASGGRVVRGTAEGGGVSLEVVHRFENGVVEADGHLRWDIGRIHREVLRGIASVPDAVSIGIDMWGVDYGLLDDGGELVCQPVAYRDDRTAKVIDDVHSIVSPEELYRITGIQFLPFNTVYQLAAERRSAETWAAAAHAVLLPDLLAYFLTGELRSELTNASTTGLADVETRDWSPLLLERLGIARKLLPAIEPPGSRRGVTSGGTAVVTVGSHDTASAVVGVPATTDRFAYVASGTWSLVGLELPHPVVTGAARQANFSNEAGVDGRTRFLRNTGGLWLLQECLREWGDADLSSLLAGAAQLPAGGPVIDVEDVSFVPPGRMADRICAAAGAHMEPVAVTRCIHDSLAAAYARTIEAASRLSGAGVEVVHIVGGGANNELLCQLTADAVRLPVIAGPVEATALGNLLVQARLAGAVPADLDDVRRRQAAVTPLWRYSPS